MSHDELLALLARSRAIHERHLFEADGEAVRDDVAEICMTIDDVLSGQALATVEHDRGALARTAA